MPECQWTRNSERCGDVATHVITLEGDDDVAGDLRVCTTHYRQADTDRDDVSVRPIRGYDA